MCFTSTLQLLTCYFIIYEFAEHSHQLSHIYWKKNLSNNKKIADTDNAFNQVTLDFTAYTLPVRSVFSFAGESGAILGSIFFSSHFLVCYDGGGNICRAFFVGCCVRELYFIHFFRLDSWHKIDLDGHDNYPSRRLDCWCMFSLLDLMMDCGVWSELFEWEFKWNEKSSRKVTFKVRWVWWPTVMWRRPVRTALDCSFMLWRVMCEMRAATWWTDERLCGQHGTSWKVDETQYHSSCVAGSLFCSVHKIETVKSSCHRLK